MPRIKKTAKRVRISVVIATKNRPHALGACLGALAKSAFRNFEVLVVNQGADLEDVERYKLPAISLLTHKKGGKSAALNAGFRAAHGDIVAITDDDCVVARGWLSAIHKAFLSGPDVSAVFGRVLPYNPEANPGKFCPSVFLSTSRRILKSPAYHASEIGFGNNMAIRTASLAVFGNMNEWLGPGSIGSNAEDAEYANRILMCGGTIAYEPDVVVRHNRWLTQTERDALFLSYYCGEMATYTYLARQGQLFASTLVRNNIRDSGYQIKKHLKRLVRGQDRSALPVTYELLKALYRMRGFMTGSVLFALQPIRCPAK